MRTNRVGQVIAASFAAVALASGCSEMPEGPAGKVVDRDRDSTLTSTWNSTTKRTDLETKYEYELTTSNGEGGEKEFKVSSDVYDKCRVGSYYPDCKRGKK